MLGPTWSLIALNLWMLAAPVRNPFLDRAIHQITTLDESAALRTLERARRWPKNQSHDVAQIELWSGLAYAGLAQEQKARACLRIARVLDPGVTLPEDASPRLHSGWDDAAPSVPVLRPPEDAPLATPPVQALPMTQAPPTWAASAPSAHLRRTLGWASLGGGAAVVGVGGLLGLRAQTLSRQAAVVGTPAGDATRIHAQATGLAQAANVLFGTGGVVMLAGLALVFTDR